MTIAVALIGLACAALWLRRVGHAYALEREEFETPIVVDDTGLARKRLPALREVSWKLEGGEAQYAWHVPSHNGAIIVYLHGSPGSRSSLLPEATALAAQGYGALLVDLPGYGKSQGKRRWDASSRESVRRAIDFAAAQPDVDPRRIAGFGYSMGTAIMAEVAADDARVRSLVLMAGFTRLEDQMRHQFRSRVPGSVAAALLAARNAGVAVDTLDTEAAVRRLGPRRLLLIAGQLDDIVPLPMPEQLARVAEHAELYVAPGVGHTGFAERLGSAYFQRLADFFATTLLDGNRREGDTAH